ncbi:hypothetical protein ANCCEY_12351 [Ancylostoma ceylanicum]|uniref:Interferon-related developmental regulator N-terminal domain-containing protein n=1 Tax=Ancylostoma ceylanicum TaxID=53326 RepID=A0A0D6LBD6_9BILA|nr:hypothetical protein ANCCEY_12351 [Ancylostoma ceylanicum]
MFLFLVRVSLITEAAPWQTARQEDNLTDKLSSTSRSEIMGKGRNKNKDKDSYSGPARKGRAPEDSDSDDSVATHFTVDEDMRSVQGDEGEDIDSPNLMDNLAENIENASHKNISIRMAALRNLQVAFCSQYIPEFVIKWRLTLIELISKNLRKTDEEIAISAVLLALASLQIGEEMGADIEECLSTLRTLVTDPSKSEQLRSLCALSIAVTTHVASINDESVAASIKVCMGYSEVDCTQCTVVLNILAKLVTVVTDSEREVHSNAWQAASRAHGFLDADGATVNSAFGEFSKLASFLEADQLDIRIATGEALAFLYELGSQSRPGFRLPNHQQIVELLDSLCSDSSKGKAKRDKRAQRLTFRQVYSSIVEKDTPSLTVKFNREALVLDSCASKLLYDVCCELLHGGIVRQLQRNELVRELFDMGPVVEVDQHEKVNKFARMAALDAASKHRNQVRGKQRDKRNVVL